MISVANIVSIKNQYLNQYQIDLNYAVVEKIIYNRNTCLPYLYVIKWLGKKTNDIVVPSYHVAKISGDYDDD